MYLGCIETFFSHICNHPSSKLAVYQVCTVGFFKKSLYYLITKTVL